jgi:hypothetical protein
MVHYLNTQNSTLVRALTELDERLYNQHKDEMPPLNLNVVSGFALLLHKVRKDPDEFTDIDFVGRELDPRIKNAADEIGIKYNLGRGWLNNDVALFDDSMKSLELMVGKVHFEPAELGLKMINVSAARPQDLLRMKVVAVDTWIMGMPENEPYTRTKDFEDIKLLIDYIDVDIDTLKFETEEYVLGQETYSLIEEYVQTGYNRLMPQKTLENNHVSDFSAKPLNSNQSATTHTSCYTRYDGDSETMADLLAKQESNQCHTLDNSGSDVP